MPAPLGTNPDLASYLNRLEDRLGLVENPQGPTALFQIASTSLTTANAVTYAFCQVLATDLNIIAHSNGAHWYREDSGGMIV